MVQLQRLKNIIKKRTCSLVASGRSIENLEKMMPQLKHLDICWCGLGVFNITENGIFLPNNKRYEVVFDCSSIPHARIPHYETFWRIPRLEEYLSRNDFNIFITTDGLKRDCFKAVNRQDIIDKYDFKIMEVDKIFPDHSWMDVPNSLTFLIASVIAGEASKIIIFGSDGYSGDIITGVKSYYKADDFEADRIAALGSNQDPGINRDTKHFEERFKTCYNRFCELFNNYPPIYNCSPITLYTFPKKITYEQLEGVLNDNSQRY
jgi:hypothetical protein